MRETNRVLGKQANDCIPPQDGLHFAGPSAPTPKHRLEIRKPCRSGRGLTLKALVSGLRHVPAPLLKAEMGPVGTGYAAFGEFGSSSLYCRFAFHFPAPCPAGPGLTLPLQVQVFGSLCGGGMVAGRALLTLNDPEVIPHGQMTPQMGRLIEDMLPIAPKPTGKDDTPLDNHTQGQACRPKRRPKSWTMNRPSVPPQPHTHC